MTGTQRIDPGPPRPTASPGLAFLVAATDQPAPEFADALYLAVLPAGTRTVGLHHRQGAARPAPDDRALSWIVAVLPAKVAFAEKTRSWWRGQTLGARVALAATFLNSDESRTALDAARARGDLDGVDALLAMTAATIGPAVGAGPEVARTLAEAAIAGLAPHLPGPVRAHAIPNFAVRGPIAHHSVLGDPDGAIRIPRQAPR